ncbi:MAG: hypothetical protein Q8T08_03905, partial [Ignavibacteria bacterium]|nr:hypothetical protein [Ignavibacteria bacterium]
SSLSKQSYMRLAQALLNEGKRDSAVLVLDKSIEFFPHKKFPYDYYMLPWVDIYFESGATEKAENVIRLLSDRYLDDLRYYTSMRGKFANYYDRNTQEALAVIQRLAELAREYNRPALEKELNDALDSQISLFDTN